MIKVDNRGIGANNQIAYTVNNQWGHNVVITVFAAFKQGFPVLLLLEYEVIYKSLFSQVQNFITHFWQGMPGHIISVLECPVVVDIVAICDSILYKVKCPFFALLTRVSET